MFQYNSKVQCRGVAIISKWPFCVYSWNLCCNFRFKKLRLADANLPKCVKRFLATCKSACRSNSALTIISKHGWLRMYLTLCVQVCIPGTPLSVFVLSGRPKLKWGLLKCNRNSAGLHVHLPLYICRYTCVRTHTHTQIHNLRRT